MLQHIAFDNVLFLDIETVPQYISYSEMPENLRNLWDKKASYLRKEEQTPEELYARAGIYAEFGRIICISIGIFDLKDKSRKLRIKSFFGDDEHQILAEFGHLLDGLSDRKTLMLCAHNGKEFDFPYIARRMLVQEIPLPYLLDISGRKPWETNFIDTMELWKFGDHKHYISLELLTTTLNIPNPKDEIDGSMIAELYWKKNDFESIVTYCEKDVIAIAQLLLRYKGETLLKPEDIIRIKD
ncbi:MAG TPA: 3'-5' exonuclease [Bacteroidales bacterium]|nr:3'-5' exonuclease [Bacteroidales bacterium]